MGKTGQRIELLDALRGFAVFGILIANIGVFEGWAWIGEDQRVALAGPTITHIDDLVQSTFIEGKFYTIFSMLFGIGVTLQYRSFAQRSADPGGMIARRLLVPLGLGYAAAFALLWPKIGARLGGLAAVGKMALTSYLTHSLIGMLLFSGFGLGLAGTLPPPWLYLLAVAIFAAQIPFSRWWLARYEQGPVEALWRRLAFGRWQSAPSAAPIS